MPRKTTKKPTRRGNNEGSIYQRKDGKWCGQVLIGYNGEGKPVRKTFYGNTRVDVSRKVSEATHQVFTGAMPTADSSVSMNQLINDYLWVFKKPAVTDVTFEWYLSLATVHIIPELGHFEVRAVTPLIVQRVVNSLKSKKGLSDKTIKEVCALLKQIFVHAIELGVIIKNPFTGVKLPKKQRKSPDYEDLKVIPKADRIRILQAADQDIRMKTAITVLMFTGMRIGEFLALPWKNVDFDNGVIIIDRAITKQSEFDDDQNLIERTTVVGSTKTACSDRSFRVSQNVLDVLGEWKEALPEHTKCKKSEDVFACNAVVFPNSSGQMRTYNGFRSTYRRFMSDNELGDYTLHSYRHTFATMLLEAGVNPKIVQKLLGHRDIETTLGIYSHVLAEVYDGVADKVAEIHADLLG